MSIDVRFDIELMELAGAAARPDAGGVVVDLSDVTAIASQYVGALAAAASKVAEGGGSLCVRARGEVAETLRRCGIDKVVALEVE